MMDFFKLIAAFTLLAASSVGFAATSAEGATDQKAIPITGASSGIGRNATEALAANGYFVYAVETVRKGGRGLHGLVNNAGVVSGGPLVEQDESDITYYREQRANRDHRFNLRDFDVDRWRRLHHERTRYRSVF